MTEIAEGIVLTEATIVQAIATVGIVLAAILAAFGTVFTVIANRGRQHAKATRDQVENDHKTNLRDDVDDLKQTFEDAIAGLTEKMTAGMNDVHDDVRLIRSEAASDRSIVHKRLADHDEQIRSLVKA